MNEKLRILLDSKSLKSDDAKRLFKYSDNDFFEFVSIGELNNYTELKISFKKDYNNSYLSYENKFGKSGFLFGRNLEDIEKMSKIVDIKYSDFILVFILETLLGSKNINTILVTERKKLLNFSHRNKDQFPNVPVHSILSPKAACIFMDLFCKNKKDFFIAYNYNVDKTYWYLLSLKTKLKNYQSVWSISLSLKDKNLINFFEGLGNKVTDMLKSVDEIGKIYYFEEVNNNSLDTITYHFNYWSILFTGTLDLLALVANYKYQLNFLENNKVGLRNCVNEDFLNELSDKNSDLVNFVRKKYILINLIYDTRNNIAHSFGMDKLIYSSGKISFNKFRIDEIFFNKIKEISKEDGSELRSWGILKVKCNPKNFCFLEPCRFVKCSTELLIDFTDKFISMLDINDNEKEISVSDDFKNDLKIFEENKLGY
ncbi:MAG: hypothetical protein KAT32_01645 [Candidatus Moranbacteria bacterium]|nr:hypothetical protein [Candidatus Moranbacteria bacterium]